MLHWQKWPHRKGLCIIIVDNDKKYIYYTKNVTYNEASNEFNVSYFDLLYGVE